MKRIPTLLTDDSTEFFNTVDQAFKNREGVGGNPVIIIEFRKLSENKKIELKNDIQLLMEECVNTRGPVMLFISKN